MRSIDRVRHNLKLKRGRSLHKQHPLSAPRKHSRKAFAQGRLRHRLRIERIRSVAHDFQYDGIVLRLCSFGRILRDRRVQAGWCTGAMAMKMISRTSNTSIIGVTLIAA